MDLKELSEIMIKNNLVIRAIPYETFSIFEVEHKKDYPNGKIYFDEKFNREMLHVTYKNKNGGKFIIAKISNTFSNISGNNWYKEGKKIIYFNSIEEAVNTVLLKNF